LVSPPSSLSSAISVSLPFTSPLRTQSTTRLSRYFLSSFHFTSRPLLSQLICVGSHEGDNVLFQRNSFRTHSRPLLPRRQYRTSCCFIIFFDAILTGIVFQLDDSVPQFLSYSSTVPVQVLAAVILIGVYLPYFLVALAGASVFFIIGSVYNSFLASPSS